MHSKQFLAFTILLFSLAVQAQETKTEQSFGEQIFLPSIEVGYIHNLAEVLDGGVLMKTSIEYRIRNNNDIFLRASYDTYNADYELKPASGLSNVIKGTAAFSDILLGAGYRFGDRKLRCFLLVQGGPKLYNFPAFTQENGAVNIEQEKSSTFGTRATLGLEYYFTEKSAFSLDFLQSQVWDNVDFWEDSGSAIGFSVGFITSLF